MECSYWVIVPCFTCFFSQLKWKSRPNISQFNNCIAKCNFIPCMFSKEGQIYTLHNLLSCLMFITDKTLEKSWIWASAVTVAGNDFVMLRFPFMCNCTPYTHKTILLPLWIASSFCLLPSHIFLNPNDAQVHIYINVLYKLLQTWFIGTHSTPSANGLVEK